MEKNPLKNRQSPEKEALRNQFSLHMTEISLSMGVNCTLVDRDNEALFRSDPTGGTNAMPMRLSCPFYMELGAVCGMKKLPTWSPARRAISSPPPPLDTWKATGA